MVERGEGEAHSFELTGAPEGGLWGGLGGMLAFSEQLSWVTSPASLAGRGVRVSIVDWKLPVT